MEVVKKESIETASTTAKVSLRCNMCSFSHRYSHILNIDQYTYSGEESYNMTEEDPRDDFEMARKTTDQEPSYIVVNGDKEWLGNYCLMDG